MYCHDVVSTFETFLRGFCTLKSFFFISIFLHNLRFKDVHNTHLKSKKCLTKLRNSSRGICLTALFSLNLGELNINSRTLLASNSTKEAKTVKIVINTYFNRIKNALCCRSSSLESNCILLAKLSLPNNLPDCFNHYSLSARILHRAPPPPPGSKWTKIF